MKFEKYFKKEAGKVDLLLKKKAQKFTPSDFHQLRVEIKKIKALFKLVADVKKNFKRKFLFKPYQSVFTRAGKIRELQQEESAFKKKFGQKKLIRYQKYIKGSELAAKRSFFKRLNSSLKKDLKGSYKIALPFLKRMKRKDLSDYLKKEEQKIKKIMGKKKLKPEKVHELRKELKTFYYNNKIRKKRSKKELVKLEKFQELLGKWHDGIVMHNHLEKAGKFNRLNSTDSKGLKKMQAENSEVTKAMFEKINKEKTPELI